MVAAQFRGAGLNDDSALAARAVVAEQGWKNYEEAEARVADLASATGASAADVQRALSGKTFVFACVIGDVALSTEADPSAVDADAFAELRGTLVRPCVSCANSL